MRNLVGPMGLVLLAACSLEAQNTGRLTGIVQDRTGAAVTRATVDLTLPDGASALFSTSTGDEGYFHLGGIKPDTYDIRIRAEGFREHHLRGVKVDPGREVGIPATTLEIGTVSETVEITTAAQNVQTSNAEISSTVTGRQVRDLPVLDRQMIALVRTQAGVSKGRGFVTINGLRTSSANVTIDGINVQDNLFRRNALDYMPNRPTVDQIEEFTVVTSNANATIGGGVSQVIMVTPSGQNAYHGSLFWYNRNSRFSANTWFNNRDNLTNPQLNQNQAGGTLGGAIIKDKLFFYGTYEAMRLNRQTAQNRVILTAAARKGLFTYRDAGGVPRQVNVLQAGGVNGTDSTIQTMIGQTPGPGQINNFRLGDSSSAFERNTAGYSFLQRDNINRNNLIGKIDYIPSVKHTFSGTYLWNNEYIDRGNVQGDSGYSAVPEIYNQLDQPLVSGGWRWNPSPHFTNEVRAGFNFSAVPFLSSRAKPERQFGGLLFSNPASNFLPNSRHTETYNVMNNASWLSGSHNLQFGFTMQPIRIRSVSELGTVPHYTIGMPQANPSLTNAHLPGASAADLNVANSLLANLAGYVTGYQQFFNVKDRTSGYVPGGAAETNLSMTTYALYLQDTWRIRPRWTVNLGLRWEPFLAVDERDSLSLLPVVIGGNPIDTLMSNATLDYAGRSVGRPWYSNDYNNFAPNVGFAWDVFGDGKTSLRSGYMISFINDNTIATMNNSVAFNQGLFTQAGRIGLNASIREGLPSIPTPAFRVPTTFAAQHEINPAAGFGMPDPGLATPYVQQWNLSMQRELSGTVFEVRYVANKATKLYRGIDFNQVDIHAGGYFEDFMRAYSNGNLSRAQKGSFSPLFDPAVAGSQALTFFPQLPQQGNIDAGNRGWIERGEIGNLASILQQAKQNGPVNFFPNLLALGTNLLTNFSNSSYHSLQLDVSRRMRHGLQIQGNYVYGKVLSDSGTETNEQFEALLDINSPSIERARAPHDLTHCIKANGVWQVPGIFGSKRNSAVLRHIFDGWMLGGNLVWQSGAPFSVFSQRSTLNRAARSSINTASTNVTKSGLDELFQLRITGDGPMFLSQSAINPADGRGVAADGAAPFSGQAFFHPGPGEMGGLQRRMFSGPWTFNVDLSVVKRVHIMESQSIELRGEAFNATNTPSWFVGDQIVSSTNFGRITSTANDRRVMQFGLYYRF